MPITVRPLSKALGAAVTGIDLSQPLHAGTVNAIRRAWLDNVILVIPCQPTDDSDQERFGRYLGELESVCSAAEESAAILDHLFDHIEIPDFIYEHVWHVGDLMLWDNRCAVHGRTWFSPGDERMMRRVTVRDGSAVV